MNDNKVIDKDKLTLGTCFFCDKLIMIEEHLSREDYFKIINLFGTVPERFGGKIGNKYICKSCVSAIWSLSQPEDY